MSNIKVSDVIRVCNGKLLCGDENIICENFSKDTRTIKKGDTYLGIKGENFNGSLLYKEAFQKGAKVCILDEVDISKEETELFVDKTIIKVENTVKALQDLAKYKRSLYDIPVIGITGSVGKTSTKDIVASVVAKKYKVLKTEGNLNNEIGMPLTILKLKDHEAMVLEMGTDKTGDLSLLTDIARPTICLFTIIGTSHIANFGSRENILKGKLEMLKGICNDKVIVINNDNDLLAKWVIDNYDKYVNDGYKIYTYGINTQSDYMAKNVTLDEFSSNYTIDRNSKEYMVRLLVGGEHFIYNSLAAFAIGEYLKIDYEDIIDGIKNFKLTKMRMDISKHDNNFIIINDTYNASYDSMKASIEYLSNIKSSKKIAILGDMLELGEYSNDLHSKVGKIVSENNIDILITVGNESKNVARSAIKHGMSEKNIYICENNNDVCDVVKNIVKLSNEAILLKASRGMKLEQVHNYIIELLR